MVFKFIQIIERTKNERFEKLFRHTLENDDDIIVRFLFSVQLSLKSHPFIKMLVL